MTVGSGARYDPAAGRWAALPMTGAPSARYDAVAVWTGRELIVWGGSHRETPLADGATYRLPLSP